MDKTLDRAWVLIDLHRFEQSEQEIRKHLSVQPEDPRAYIALTVCLSDLSRYPEAIESARKAITLIPGNPFPYWLLGCVYLQIQKIKTAENYLFKAIELYPENPSFYASLAQLYCLKWYIAPKFLVKRRKYLYQAIEAARSGLSIEPEHQGCLAYLANSLLAIDQQKHTSQAIAIAKELISVAPDNAMAHQIYGRALIGKIELTKKRATQKDVDLVIAIFEECLRLDPNFKDIEISVRRLLSLRYAILYNLPLWCIEFLTLFRLNTCWFLTLAMCSNLVWSWPIHLTAVLFVISSLCILLTFSTIYMHLKIWLIPRYRKLWKPDSLLIDVEQEVPLIVSLLLAWQFMPKFMSYLATQLFLVSSITPGMILITTIYSFALFFLRSKS